MNPLRWLNVSLGWHARRVRLGWLWGGIRWGLYRLLPRQTEEYGSECDVPGYLGWIDVPAFGAVAFIRDDGSLQFRW